MENTESCFLARRLTKEYFRSLKQTGYGNGVLVVEHRAMQDLSPPTKLLSHIGECTRCSIYYETCLAQITGIAIDYPEYPKPAGKKPQSHSTPPPIKYLGLDDGSLILETSGRRENQSPANSSQTNKYYDLPVVTLIVLFMLIAIGCLNHSGRATNLIGWVSLIAGIVLGIMSLIRMQKN